MTGTYETYDAVRARLDEIVDAVNAEGVTLDEALALYEEAVKLGLRACDLSEEDAQALADDAAEGGGDAAGEDGAGSADAGEAESAGGDDAAGEEGAAAEDGADAGDAAAPAAMSAQA